MGGTKIPSNRRNMLVTPRRAEARCTIIIPAVITQKAGIMIHTRAVCLFLLKQVLLLWNPFIHHPNANLDNHILRFFPIDILLQALILQQIGGARNSIPSLNIIPKFWLLGGSQKVRL
jgi:hypothetical protein